MGITCLVVNPADIPSSHKDEVYKTDSRDSRGIGQALTKGQLRGIYIPPLHQEVDRNLVRQRKKIWRDLVHCKNRVKGFLDYNGTNLPAKFDNPNWSRNSITWLLSLAFPFESTSLSLKYQIREVELPDRNGTSNCSIAPLLKSATCEVSQIFITSIVLLD